MPSSSYAKQKAKEFYVKHAIERRLEKVIDAAKEKDNRYYLLEKVLSSDTVRQCLNLLPSRTKLSSIQKGGDNLMRKLTAITPVICNGLSEMQTLFLNNGIPQSLSRK